MTQLSQRARRVACAVGLLLSTVFATPTWASAIYEFREVGTSALIGTLEIATPPASATAGWDTIDASDLIALHLTDSLFGLGTGNLLSTAATVSAVVLSLDGLNLDVGGIAVSFPTIVPINPLDPAIDRFLSLVFDVSGGADFIGLATIKTSPSGVVIEDQLLHGDWQEAASVPEPATAALMMIGLAAAVRVARRNRR